MGIVVGYIFEGPRTCTARKQLYALKKAGVDRDSIWKDVSPSREERDEMIYRGLRSGDVVVIAMASIIGSGGNTRDRLQVVKRLGEMGVRIQIADGPPILYDDAEKIADFMAEAGSGARRLSGRLLGKKARGRPIKIPITDEQKKVICPLWWDREVQAAKVRRIASELVGHDVERHHLQHWCGPLRQKPKDKAK
ncbi:MAG: hypothetical protein AAGL24_10180 [Pseudomonadota bacterium]